MGRYQAYAEYKDSGITWMTHVPDHWKEIRFKHVFLEKKKISNPELEAGSISFGNVVFKNSENLAPETKASYQEVKSGEFLVNPLNLNFDLISLRTALSRIDVVVSTGYIVLISNERYEKNYLRWLLQQFDVSHMKTLGAGVRQTINYSDIANSCFFEPTREEQQGIANFLDHETAKIDTLIEKQQQLIQLLKEKRQAVISHAVSKGLNPDVPMKDSGVEWLGEVPEHWDGKSLNHLIAHTVDNRGRTPPIIEEGIPMCEVSQVAGNGFYASNDFSKFISKKSYDQFVRSDVKENDVLFVTVGATFGKTCLVPPAPDFFIAQNVVGFRCKYDVDPKYFMFLLSSEVFKEAISATNKASTIDNVKVSDLVRTKLAVPPLIEQTEIANYIFAMVDKYEALIGQAMLVINLLQERRTALISAAVTGKIDVRLHASRPAGSA